MTLKAPPLEENFDSDSDNSGELIPEGTNQQTSDDDSKDLFA